MYVRLPWIEIGRLQLPCGLRHELSSLAQTLVSRVRIPLKAWMSVCVYSAFVLFCEKKLKKMAKVHKGCRAIDMYVTVVKFIVYVLFWLQIFLCGVGGFEGWLYVGALKQLDDFYSFMSKICEYVPFVF
jgi:hypothetical protein